MGMCRHPSIEVAKVASEALKRSTVDAIAQGASNENLIDERLLANERES